MIDTHPWAPKNDNGFANLPSHDTWVSGVPYSTFKRMRDEKPVCWTPEKDDSGFWSITRYQDVVEANHRWDEFSSKNGIRLEEMDHDEVAKSIARVILEELGEDFIQSLSDTTEK